MQGESIRLTGSGICRFDECADNPLELLAANTFMLWR